MAARGSTIGGEACQLPAGRNAARYCIPRSRLDAHVASGTQDYTRSAHVACWLLSKDSESMRLAFMRTRLSRICAAGGDPQGPGPVDDGCIAGFCGWWFVFGARARGGCGSRW